MTRKVLKLLCHNNGFYAGVCEMKTIEENGYLRWANLGIGLALTITDCTNHKTDRRIPVMSREQQTRSNQLSAILANMKSWKAQQMTQEEVQVGIKLHLITNRNDDLSFTYYGLAKKLLRLKTNSIT